MIAIIVFVMSTFACTSYGMIFQPALDTCITGIIAQNTQERCKLAHIAVNDMAKKRSIYQAVIKDFRTGWRKTKNNSAPDETSDWLLVYKPKKLVHEEGLIKALISKHELNDDIHCSVENEKIYLHLRSFDSVETKFKETLKFEIEA